MSNGAHDERGRFAPGNPGGPGRPRWSIERDYLATLSDAVSLDDWRQIVGRAVADAKAGDTTARTWLAKHLIGDRPPTLIELAAKEHRGVTVEADLDASVTDQQREAARQARLDAILERLG